MNNKMHVHHRELDNDSVREHFYGGASFERIKIKEPICFDVCRDE